MSNTDHARRSTRPEHGDYSPRFQPRPPGRRQRTRRQAVLVAMREV